MTTYTTHIDWDQVPALAARAHALRSAEMRRMAKAAVVSVVGFARRLIGRPKPTGLRAAGC